MHLKVSCAVIEEPKSYKNYKIIEIQGATDDLKQLVKSFVESHDVPIYEFKNSSSQILVAPELVPALELTATASKLRTNVIVEDFSKLLDSEALALRRSSKRFSWTAYYDIDDIYAYLRNTSTTYSNWTELIEGGQSYENRKILGLRINTPTGNDKPVMFIESGIHAREWITPATTTYFINELLTSEDPKISAMRDQFDWRIFPVVNPDGYHYTFTKDRMWRKTRSLSPNGCRGADPNRNWDYNWMEQGSSNNPCDYQVYAGSEPFSEIETRSLSDYIAQIENLRGYIGFHSNAQCLLLPYSDSTDHVDNYDDLVQIGKVSLEYGRAVNGETYEGPGTAAEILYKVSGGSMDWVRNKLGTPLVYTFELRGVSFLWPARLIYQQGDEVTQMMLGLVTEANNLGYF